MTEYITKEQAFGLLPEDSLWARKALDEIPPADVIERSEYNMMTERCKAMTNAFIELQKDNKDLRSKIDKAIEEIRNLKTDGVDDDFYDCKYEVLKILENIYIQKEKENKNGKRS